MRKGHISESYGGRHQNAGRGSAELVTASGSRISDGKPIAVRTQVNSRGGRVLDSPPYVPPPVRYCSAVRADGKPCKNIMTNENVLCFGHRAGNGAHEQG